MFYYKFIIGLIDDRISTDSSEIIKPLMDSILQYLNHPRKESISKEYKQKSNSKAVEIMIEMFTNIPKAIKNKFKTAGDEYHDFIDPLSSLIQDYEDKFKEILNGKEIKAETPPISFNNSLVAVS